MYIDISNTEKYPKTLVIRNTSEGMIWQLYHINNEFEAKKLATTAHSNGFYGLTLEDHQPEEEETFPTWRQDVSPKWFNE